MPLRRYLVGATTLVVAVALVPISHLAFAQPQPHHRLAVKEMPRPVRQHPDKKRDFEPHTVLVRYASGVSAAAKERALTKRGAKNRGAVPGTGYVKVSTKRAAADVLRELRKDPAVSRVSLDYRRQATATPNDEEYTVGDQNYLQTVRLPQAWDRTKGSTSQVIAVVDTGVNGLHADLKGRTVGGYNALTNVLTAADSATDDNGHGSMVAGIAAANTNNSIGIAGVAWTGRIMPVKVLGSDGTGYDSDIAEGITWAANHGAKIINLSLSGPQDSTVLHDAVTYATGKGALVVAASGNDGDDTPQYPAAYPEVLAVGATDGAGNLTDFSSWGDWIDVAAPGFGIVSTGLNQDYYIADGTSLAAPIAAGVAALTRTAYPTLTPAQVISRLKATARDAGPRGIDPYYGYGVVDAYYAVGGTWGTEFAQRALGTGEPNDVPARATAFSTSVTGTVAMEGDVDWYRFDSTGEQPVSVQVTPPAYDQNRAQNFDPVLAVYDQDLRLVGEVDDKTAGVPESLSPTLAAGRYYVSVRSYNGAADTRSYTVSVGPASGALFNPAQATPVGSWPETVAIGDVTGDGRADVLLATSYYFDPANDYKLFLFAQNADGSLAAPVRYPTAMESAGGGAGIALLDADGDGRRDVALATGAGVQIFHQGSDGKLTDAGLLPGTTGAGALVAADMDGDGDTDLVLTQAAGITLATHQADGTFVPSAVTADGTGEVEVGDVDGDGRPDVVGFQGGMVHVYHHTDTGWNRTDHDTIRGYWPNIEGIEVADVSGDGRADVIASIGGNSPGSRINVFVQNATGGLNTPANYATRDIPEPVEAADINGDGRTDVVTAHGGWNTLSVLPQLADGTLGTPVTSAIPYASHYNVQGLALGDINGDKRTDVVIADYNNGLVVLRRTGPSPGGEQVWVRSAGPADFATGQAQATVPTVTFQRDVDASSVTTSTVRLVHGRTGATVPATVTYDAATRTASLKPSAALQDNTPYRIVVNGLRDAGGAAQAGQFTSTFRTVDVAPPAVSGLKAAVGGIQSVSLSWTLPSITDLDQVIVRMAPGNTAPAGPTVGTAAYAGAGSSATISGLTGGSNYAFGVWVRDRSGKYSPATNLLMVGTTVSVSSSTTAVTYGGAVTVTGRVVRPDSAAGVAAQQVLLYGRRKGTTAWVLIGTATSSSTGALTLSFTPAWSLDYHWSYRGSASYIGSMSANRSTGVRTVISSTLSKASIPLGTTVALYGSVTPNHAGKPVYLQRLVSGVWTTVTSYTLTSTSGYNFAIKPTARGTYYYRVYKPADTDHLAGYTVTRTLRVT